MSIRTLPIFELVAGATGAGVASDRLKQAFPYTVNYTLDQLANAADEATKFEHVSGTEDTIDELSDHYGYIILAGVMYWLVRLGIRPGDPRTAATVFGDTERMWNTAKAEYITARLNDTQSDEDEDVAKLGSVV